MCVRQQQKEFRLFEKIKKKKILCESVEIFALLADFEGEVYILMRAGSSNRSKIEGRKNFFKPLSVEVAGN